MVDTDADCCMMLLADVEEWHETLANLLYLLCVFLVGVFEFLKCAPWIDIVTRVDAHLLDYACCHISHISIEMDVCHQRHVVAVGSEVLLDVGEVQCLLSALSSESHDVGTSIYNALDLCHRSFGVVGIGIGHRLNADGIVATNSDLSHIADR